MGLHRPTLLKCVLFSFLGCIYLPRDMGKSPCLDRSSRDYVDDGGNDEGYVDVDERDHGRVDDCVGDDDDDEDDDKDEMMVMEVMKVKTRRRG